MKEMGSRNGVMGGDANHDGRLALDGLLALRRQREHLDGVVPCGVCAVFRNVDLAEAPCVREQLLDAVLVPVLRSEREGVCVRKRGQWA